MSGKNFMPPTDRWLLNAQKTEANPGAWATVMFDAVNHMLMVCEHLLKWRAQTWPDDPSTHDGGWCDEVCVFIERFGNLEVIEVPELYRARFENVSLGLAYNVDELMSYMDAHPEALSGSSIRVWLAAHATIPLPENWQEQTFTRDELAQAEQQNMLPRAVSEVLVAEPEEVPAVSEKPKTRRTRKKAADAEV